MQFVDLKAQQEKIKEALAEAMQRVLNHGQYIMGPEVKELEAALARRVGVKHAITVANGTDALMLCLMAINIKPGDEVITSAFSFYAAAEVIVFLGAKPVLVDIDPQTYNMRPELVEAAISEKTRAIIPVDLYGNLCDYPAINDIAANHNLVVIQDAAQSFGARLGGEWPEGSGDDRQAPGFAHMGCTSFFPAKPLGCYGDGGAIFTDRDDLAETIGALRLHGSKQKYCHEYIGINSRLDTLQAAVLLEKLKIFDAEWQAKQELAAFYKTNLEGAGFALPQISPHAHALAVYTLRHPSRDAVIEKLKKRGIPAAVHYPRSVADQPAMPMEGAAFPEANKAAREVFSLPMHAYLEEKDRHAVCDALKEIATQF